MKNYDVTVLVVTYFPAWKKLKSTLLSIVCQKDVSFEIIVSDDGSEVDFFDDIERFFIEQGFSDFKLIKNIKNLGTVNNYYNALCQAQGEYTYGISPGDMLYDEYTLSDLYSFSKQNEISVCFGDAIYYNLQGDKVNVVKKRHYVPRRPWIYTDKTSLDIMKYFFFYDNFILGATFFRRTDVAIKYIGKIKDLSRYVEDNTSTAFMLADGLRVIHLDKYVVWYEYGEGISTSSDNKWGKLLDADLNNSFDELRQQYPNDKVINTLLQSRHYRRFYQKIYLLLNVPRLFLRKLIIKFTPMSNKTLEYDVSILQRYING